MQQDRNNHAQDETLEQYATESLAEPALAELEEHLLLCSHCQGRLKEIDAYVAAMRGAAAKLERNDESHRRFWMHVSSTLTFRRLGWAMSVAAVVLFAVAVRVSWKPAGWAEPLALTLETSRGAEIQHAPAGRPLNLSLDITGLAASAAYQIEIVDATGRRLAESRAEPKQARVRTSASKGLPHGTYFIRVYSASRELLREYGLQVD